jgi:hypothetical protein
VLASLAGGLALAVAGAVRAGEPLLLGDQAHAAPLWRLHCAGCHGAWSGAGEPTPIGRQLGAYPLRDAALLAGRSEEELLNVVVKGGPGPGSPALLFLSPLEAADLVAWMRAGLPGVADAFPGAAAFTVKRYALPGPAVARAEALGGGALSADERQVTVFSVYGGTQPPLGPRLVPQRPIALEAVRPRDRRGWLVFGALPAGRGEPQRAPQPLALALDNGFLVERLAAPGADLGSVAPAVLGHGSREPGKRRPFAAAAAPEQAAALTRLYARAVEGAAMAAKDEADRHIFDTPESTPPGPAGRQLP